MTYSDSSELEDLYYKELNYAKRKELLDQLLEIDADSPENNLRRKIYNHRYAPVKGSPQADAFIRGWMTLEYLKAVHNKFLFTKRQKEKELKSLREDWMLDEFSASGEIGEHLMFREFYHLVSVYIDSCQRDRSYNSVLLGLGKIKSGTFHSKIADDIFSVAYTLPKDLGIKDELKTFTRAATQCFCDHFPNSASEFMDRAREE